MGLGRKLKKALKSAVHHTVDAIDSAGEHTEKITDSISDHLDSDKLGKAMGTIPEEEDLPPIEDPVVMPLPDDELVRTQRRKSLVAQRRRSGRQSTIYSGDTLG